jgi:hypothetical protein
MIRGARTARAGVPASRLLKKGVERVNASAAGVLYCRGFAFGGRDASAAGSDPRPRDEGDAVCIPRR